MKRLFITILITIMALPMLRAEVIGGDNAGANISWSLDTDTHVLTLTGEGIMYEWGLYSASMGAPWWSYRSQIHRVILSEGITRIGGGAFYECNIDSITLPSTIATIGTNAFYKCNALKSYKVAEGNTVYSAHDGVLYSADGTRLILFPYAKDDQHTAPMTMTVLPEGCIYETNIKELYLPAVTELDSAAIRYCHKLERIHFSDALDTVALGAIQRCPNLRAIDVPETNPRYTTVDSVLYTKDTTLLVKFPEHKEYADVDDNTGIYTLPIAPQVKRIGDYAFSYCNTQRIIYFNLPQGLEQIDGRAFYGSYYWGTFIMNAWNDHVPAVTPESFQFYGAKEVYVPYFDYKTWAADPVWSTLPLHYRPQEVYSGDLDLIHWTYTTATKTLDLTGRGPMPVFCDPDFYGWWLLRDSIVTCTIADGITYIGTYAFVGDTMLTSINIPESIVGIGYYAFDGCKNLTLPTLPDNIERIEDYAFRGCQHTPVWTQEFPSALTYIGAANYVGLQGPTAITFPSKLKHIGDSAFAGCPNVEYIQFQNAPVEHIGNYAFADCPKSNMSITGGEGLPATLEYIGDDAFAIYNVGINSATKHFPAALPDSLEHIGKSAFLGRNILWTNTIILPEPLNFIGDSAFVHAKACTIVRSNARTAPKIGAHTFPAALEKVYVALGTLASFTSSNYWPQLNCHIGDFTLRNSGASASSVNLYIYSEYDADKIDHMEAKDYELVMYPNSNTEGYVLGLQPQTNYDLEIYAVSVAGDRERFLINVTTEAIEMSLANIQRADSFFRFSANLNMPGLTEGLGFEIQAMESHAPYGDTLRIKAKTQDGGSYFIEFFADTILLNYGQVGDYKYRVRPFYYDAQHNRTYHPSETGSEGWEYIVIEDPYYPCVPPLFTIDTVSVEAREATFKINFQSFGSTTITNFDVKATSFTTWISEDFGSIPFEGNDEQVFTVSGFEPETEYEVTIFIKALELENYVDAQTLFITTTSAPQGFDTIHMEGDQPVKILRNGQIYILRGENIYLVTGQKVK